MIRGLLVRGLELVAGALERAARELRPAPAAPPPPANPPEFVTATRDEAIALALDGMPDGAYLVVHQLPTCGDQPCACVAPAVYRVERGRA